jgi:hypothetical protein
MRRTSNRVDNVPVGTIVFAVIPNEKLHPTLINAYTNGCANQQLRPGRIETEEPPATNILLRNFWRLHYFINARFLEALTTYDSVGSVTKRLMVSKRTMSPDWVTSNHYRLSRFSRPRFGAACCLVCLTGDHSRRTLREV